MWTNVCLCVCRFICLRVWLTRQRSCCVRSSAGSPTDRSECDSSKVASTTWPTTGKEWLWKLSGVLTWKISIVSLFRRKFFLGLKFESKKKTQVTSFMIHKTEKQYFVSVFISFLLFFCSCFWPSFFYVYLQVRCGFFASATQTFRHFPAVRLQLRHSLDHHVRNINNQYVLYSH